MQKNKRKKRKERKDEGRDEGREKVRGYVCCFAVPWCRAAIWCVWHVFGMCDASDFVACELRC